MLMQKENEKQKNQQRNQKKASLMILCTCGSFQNCFLLFAAVFFCLLVPSTSCFVFIFAFSFHSSMRNRSIIRHLLNPILLFDRETAE